MVLGSACLLGLISLNSFSPFPSCPLHFTLRPNPHYQHMQFAALWNSEACNYLFQHLQMSVTPWVSPSISQHSLLRLLSWFSYWLLFPPPWNWNSPLPPQSPWWGGSLLFLKGWCHPGWYPQPLPYPHVTQNWTNELKGLPRFLTAYWTSQTQHHQKGTSLPLPQPAQAYFQKTKPTTKNILSYFCIAWYNQPPLPIENIFSSPSNDLNTVPGT